jgi:ABC-type amino acid transport substrate-binding protein
MRNTVGRGLHQFVLAFALTAAGWVGQAAARDTLKICLEEDSPPYSYKFGKKIGGFDFDLAAALAARLRRDLKVQWFEFEMDEENIPKLEANALLSARLCHLIGGYPMMKSALGSAPQGTFRLPDHEGQKRSERNKLIKLGTVVPSAPYHRTVIGVVVGPKVSREIRGLDDLAGLRIMSEVATLPSVLLMRHKAGMLIDDTSHISPLKNIFELMDEDKADATLIEVHRFERYRFRNPDTKLRFSGFLFPLGFNFGFAALQTAKPLLDEVNKALTNLAAEGKLKEFAANNGMTLFAPEPPFVMEKFKLP